MRPGMLAGTTHVHGDTYALATADRAVVAQAGPWEGWRAGLATTPSRGPFWLSPDTCHVLREVSPTCVAPDAWPAHADTWRVPVGGSLASGLPRGWWLSGCHVLA